MSKLKILELYSGVGGMHCALSESGIDFEVVAAVDINPHANKIYQHNFPDSNLIQKTIESFKVQDFDKLDIDIVLMSPPCQPFVRVGLQKDLEDKRTASFIYFLKMLPLMVKRPSYILLENVKGFDTSQTRTMMLNTLTSLNYQIQEYLLTPLQFGIPNSRLRYYMLAKSNSRPFASPLQSGIQVDLPGCVQGLLRHRNNDKGSAAESSNNSNIEVGAQIKPFRNSVAKGAEECDKENQTETTCDSGAHSIDDNEAISKDDKNGTSVDSNSDNEQHVEEPNLAAYEKYRSICGPVGKYLESKDTSYFEQFLIPEKFFKRFWVMDIVTDTHHNCCCFTKRYAHHIEGAGSILQTNLDSGVDLKVYKKRGTYGEDVHEAVRSLKLRFFTPREIANLMCFPQSFDFPSELSNIQCYRALGNSLNVHVVAVLIQLLVMEPAANSK